MKEPVVVSEALAIPADELQFRYARSSGPGGQHVNKTATQVELLFDVGHSPSLNEAQRARITQALGRRIDSDGVLHLVSGVSRSQVDNRADVTQRLGELLAAALRPVKPRRPTRPSRTARQKRLTAKKARGAIKKQRTTSQHELE